MGEGVGFAGGGTGGSVCIAKGRITGVLAKHKGPIGKTWAEGG